MASIISLISGYLEYAKVKPADPAGTWQSRIFGVETCNNSPTLACISKIARTLRLGPSDLLGDTTTCEA